MAPRSLPLASRAGIRRACAGACLLALFALAGCGGGGGSSPKGRLRGTVMRGPTTPVCRTGTPCTAPASGLRIVFVGYNRMAAQPVIAKDGSYSVSLRPGTYSVGFLHRDHTVFTVGRIVPSTVRVVAGRTRTVDFSIDTGIR